MDTARRSLVKSTLWMLLGGLVMTLVGLALTGSITLGGTMAAINAGLGFVTYLIYERIWTRISWGRV